MNGEGHPRAVSRDRSRECIVAKFTRRTAHYRHDPDTGRLSRHARISNKLGSVSDPGGDNSPIHLRSIENLRLRNVLSFSGFNEFDMNAIQVGVSQTSTIWGNRATDDRVFTGIGGELPLLQLR